MTVYKEQLLYFLDSRFRGNDIGENKWQINLEEPADAPTNMFRDKKLFEDFETGKIPPTIRIYSWNKVAITYGYRIRLEQYLNLKKLEKEGISWAARITGGGIVFHHPFEVTFAVILPRRHFFKGNSLLEPYFFTSGLILNFLNSCNLPATIQKRDFKNRPKLNNPFCFEETAPFDIILDSQKVAGIAQKKGKNCFFQQGTIKITEVRKNLGKEFFKFLKDINFNQLLPNYYQSQ